MTKTINGKKYEMLVGSRAQVWHGTSYKTSGGLKKSDLMMNKAGRIVSKAKHNTAKKDKRLLKAGYGTKKVNLVSYVLEVPVNVDPKNERRYGKLFTKSSNR